MLTYELVKAHGMETILNGVKALATARDHEECKKIIIMIKQTCDAQLALEDLEIAMENGDVQGMIKAMSEYGF